MILIDTSAWVEFDRSTGSAINLKVRSLIANDGAIGVTEPVVMELVGGARSTGRESEIRRLMARFTLMPFDAAIDFNGAARIYRQCRRAGVTPRGYVDCMIAAVALRHAVPVLAHDKDFDRLAAVVGVQLASA